RHEFSGPGGARTTRSDLFPTLHIDHPLAKTLDLSLSYSKRIDRADVDNLRAYPIVTGLQSVSVGNPALRDQSTDSFEANLHHHRGKLDLGLIVYDRETRQLWGSAYQVNPAGMNVVTTLNTGHGSDRGAEIDLSTPLLHRVKASASLNLFDSRVPVDPGGARRTGGMFRYTGNAAIEYGGAAHGERPGDIAQLQLAYDGPRRAYQTFYEGHVSLALVLTHSFTKTLALTGTLEGVGSSDYRHRLDAPLVHEDYSRRDSTPLFKLKAVKSFGGAH
ncbi:MAG: hypothetical protein JWP15_3003, partial [Alphaproteobacteria bacterium]|nr:hypothetical protein [Alphaproteobacteria bacterium]